MRFFNAHIRAKLAWAAMTFLAFVLLTQDAGASSLKVKVGQIVNVVSSAVHVNKSSLKSGDHRSLYAGQTISTNDSGQVQYNLKTGGTTLYCVTWSARQHARWYTASVTLNGSSTDPLTWNSGGTTCSKKGPQNIAPQAGAVSLQMVDPVFEVVVAGKSTIVRVQRGVVTVAPSMSAPQAAAVVVGRNKQTTITSGVAAQPTAIPVLHGVEKTSLAAAAATLPPITDNVGPSITVDGPSGSSSLRNAEITFSSDENGVTFSCNLDGNGFHPCMSPVDLTDVKPGSHTFTVQGLDTNGNPTQKRVSWTVDASRIAFADDASGHYDIYTMNPDGSDIQQLTKFTGDNEDPAWSPSRQQIAFQSTRKGASEIYVMNADGSNQTALTSDPAGDRNPAWSPDGKEIVYESGKMGSRQLFIMNADGSGARPLTSTSGENFDPTWSPDGSKIAFASSRDGNDEIYVMNSDGSGQTDLTDNPATEFNPSWSADGTRIAFHSDRDGVSPQIFVMNADGSNQTRLSNNTWDDYNPSWAPDGNELVFQSDADTHPTMAIYVMNADGSHRFRLTTGSSNAITPDWGFPLPPSGR